MARKDTKWFFLGIAVAGGIGWWYFKKKRDAQPAGPTQAQAAALVKKLTGKLPAVARLEAVARGDKYYATKDPTGAPMCFVTRTGAKAPMSKCLEEGAPGLLAGLGSLGHSGLGSLR